MKIKKVFIMIAMFFIAMALINSSLAYTVTIDDIKAKEGEQFTVNFKVDQKTPLANGHIKFDKSKVEFVETKQDNMQSTLVEDGNLAFIYVDMVGEGENNFEFVFKSISNGESEIKFEDLALVDEKGNEYTEKNISGNTTIKVNKKNNVVLIIIGILCVLIIVFIIAKKSNKK